MNKHRKRISPPQYATVLNGTSQYWSKTSPNNLDLNGVEMITATDDRTFETTVGNWLGSGNHSITRSTVDKRTGTASGAIVASGAGDAISKCGILPANSFGDVVGAEQITNGGMEGTYTAGRASGWSADGASAYAEEATIVHSGSKSQKITGDANQGVFQSYTWTAGVTYQLSAWVYIVSGSVTMNKADQSISDNTSSVIGSWVMIRSKFIAIASGANTIRLYCGSAGTVVYWDDISLKVITSSSLTVGNKYTIEGWARAVGANAKITASIGTKSAQSATLSTVAGTFTKFVLNFQATASEVGQPLKLYINQADTVYVDDISVTQAYDAIILSSQNINSYDDGSLNGRRIAGYRDASTVGFGHFFNKDGIVSSNFLTGVGLIATATGVSVVQKNIYSFAASSYNRIGNVSVYLNGNAVDGSVAISALGKITPSAGKLRVGTNFAEITAFFSGNIGSVQIIRFTSLPSDGGASIIADAYNRFKQKKPFAISYPNGTVVASYDWKAQGRDISNNGNDLAPVNTPPIIKV